ncbi:MAG: cyclic-di-AMP receptor [Peptoniphilaceae bacterium]|nr:cyclic-di-AMP receptor [Peptoniphilaceae bacterium]MDY6085703.1 cyclic-di-AMP receptor [Peptoniphilaceae bacterium]
MKLLICIVQDSDAVPLMEDLVENQFRVTRLSSTGGFLKSGNTTLFLGVEEEEVQEALGIIRRNCSRRKAIAPVMSPQLDPSVYSSIPVEIEVGGATVFQIDIDAMFRI